MTRKRVTVLTINSITTISKVRRSRSNQISLYNNLLEKFKSLNLVKNISTATAERSDLFTESGNSNGFQKEFEQNPSTGQSENPSNTYRQNQTDVYRGNPNEYQNKEFYVNGNGGFHQSRSDVYRRNPNTNEYQNREFQQNGSGFHKDNPSGYQQNQTDVHRVNASEYQNNVIQQNPSGFHKDNPSVFKPNEADSYRGKNPSQHQNREFQQNPSGFQRGNSSNVFQSNQADVSRGNYPSEYQNRVFQHNSSGFQGQNHFPVQPNQTNFYGGNNSNGYKQTEYQHNSVELQKNSNGYQRENVGGFQQNPIGQLGVNTTPFNQNSNGYGRESVGGLQQNPDGTQRVASNFQAQSVNNVKSEETEIETSETNQYKGTIDEMDTFCKEGKVKEAVEVLSLLEKQGIIIDLPIYFQLIKVCGEAEATEEAKAIHNHLTRSMPHMGVSVKNKVLDMYLKCGSVSDAYDLFDNMTERNLTSWDTMIIGLTKNGLGEDAIDLFTQFKGAGLKPDGQMFFGVFSACTALCDISEGLLHFETMSKVFDIVPTMDHYVSVVEMLGSTGYIDEALEFIERMPMEPSIDVWETLMNLCRTHGNLELGDRCAEIVENLDPSRLNDQSKAGFLPVKASDVAKAEEKKKSQNPLEIRNKIVEYRAGDTSGPQKDEVYAQLRRMNAQMREVGYVPETKFVLHDIDEESKEEALLAHSERLAVSYGLISSSARSPMRIIKNLRVCGDCHKALKIISKIVGRELIIRDAKRFHHFRNGLCSCNDYW